MIYYKRYNFCMNMRFQFTEKKYFFVYKKKKLLKIKTLKNKIKINNNYNKWDLEIKNYEKKILIIIIIIKDDIHIIKIRGIKI